MSDQLNSISKIIVRYIDENGRTVEKEANIEIPIAQVQGLEERLNEIEIPEGANLYWNPIK